MSIFIYFYYKQQEKTAAVILHNISTELAEVNYIISKNLTTIQDVSIHRALLDRIAVNNDFIKSIIIHDGQNILLATDPFFKKILSTEKLENNEEKLYKQVIKKEAIEDKIRFYVHGKLHTLNLMFVLDQVEIKLFFSEKGADFFLLFAIIPFFVIFFVWIIVRRLILNPLEALRQFVYYQGEVPKAFTLQELEVIRRSMVETFTRLENEKKELYEVARRDSLSGLANRNALLEYLDRLIASSKREEHEFAMLFLDLDHFKRVNDELGHNVGDDLLKSVASRIDGILRSPDFVARVGGDEFVVILKDYKSLLELTHVIDRIQEALAETWIIQTNPINISSSIGIAFYPKDGTDIVTLMKNSDIAMYEAKKNGRSRYSFFTEELNEKVQDRIILEREMREALKNKEYELFYQPKVDVATGKITSAEALIRWISPEKGLIPPDMFIPVAEEGSFIIDLGEWIFKTAIQQQSLFKKNGIDIKISINLSPKQLFIDDFAEKFINYMEEVGLKPTEIDIEITENLFFQHSNNNIEVLNTLHEYGISISLDDFGTGYSSLSYLKDFPIDYLKIDKSFMDSFDDEQGSIFIETIVKMGQTLNLGIIAEGIETEKQLEYLKSINCNEYQGYLCSKPLNVKDFEDFYLATFSLK
ncbi:EAL domain-containing protein [Sulfurimonas sp.]|nr:EAL domain-containing protein [Sulfurimonas sp.]